MPDLPTTERLIELQRLMLELRAVKRAMPVHDDTQDLENDVEHSYAMAIMALYLAPKIDPKLDTAKLLTYALVHDLVEIYAGDSPAFEKGHSLKAKQAREHEAFKRLKSEWPDFPEMIEAIEAYESLQNSESVFIRALDVVQAQTMVALSRDIYWKHYQVGRERYLKFMDSRLEKTKGQRQLHRYAKEMFDYFKDRPELLS